MKSLVLLKTCITIYQEQLNVYSTCMMLQLLSMFIPMIVRLYYVLFC